MPLGYDLGRITLSIALIFPNYSFRSYAPYLLQPLSLSLYILIEISLPLSISSDWIRGSSDLRGAIPCGRRIKSVPPRRPRSHSSSICGNPTIEAAMVADAHPQPQRQPQQPPSSSPEDEALKRNTDCVYFLASPLTCKKGSECEYRHSEYARVNPRDCWFWLNSNCLNPKCSFRHPPLDGLLGNQAEISSGSSLAPSQPAFSAAIHVPCSASKQAVPCIFFQQGMCFKGDRCAFLHGPNTINKPPQASTAPSLTQPPSFKRVFGSLVKCAQGQKVSQPSITTPVEPPNAKPFGKPENTPLRTEALVPENLPPSMALGAEGRFKQSTGPAIVNGSAISQSNHMHQSLVSDDHSFQNGKDADESIRESSPGFDVLVDDELRDADYYHDEDQYGRMRGRDGQFDLVRPSDFNSMVDIERERLHDPRGFDSYEREQHRASSERNFVGNTARVDRRRSYPKVENPDQIDESDLRHRLSKQRRVSGVRSVICHDYDRERHIEERSYRGPHRDSPRDSALSNRFRGRINLPRKSSPTRGSDLHLRRDSDKGRSRARSSPSPGKPQISSQLGRLRDRIKGVADEDFVRRPPISRGIMDDTSTDFAGPKSLAELKGGRNVENKEQSSSSRNLLFKGPKPLDTILKRKQEADAGSSADTMHNNEGSINKENNSNDERARNDEEERKSAGDAAAEEAEKNTLACGKSSNGVGPEEGVIEDGEEDQEPEAYDQREGEYDYEHNLDGEEYDINGGENAEYLEEEEEEDDDGDDDFAKKIGVMFT